MSLLLGIIYLSFISLGLPDALLGAAWPDMYPIPGSGILRGNDIHDHCVWNDHFQSAE